MRNPLIVAYESAMAEALRAKVEEEMLQTMLGDDEAAKEVYRSYGFGRAPLTRDQEAKR